MLTIRLSSIGKKNKPMYRLTISEKARDPYGRALEILGSYNPYTKELKVKNGRIEYWLSKGSGMSPTVNNLLIEKGIIKGKKVKATKAKRGKKGEEEKKESVDKKPAESNQESEKKSEENKKDSSTTEDKPKLEEIKTENNEKPEENTKENLPKLEEKQEKIEKTESDESEKKND
ncbi:MAG: 30S ribosomal protein S16 [Patescibacteria group bacterium]